MPGDARGSVCVAAICRYTSLVCSVVQEYGATARRRRSKWRHDSAPMNQNSTAAHRPAAPLTTAPDTALWPPDYPDRDSDRDATSHPSRMKIRHLNPRQMISIPEQRVTIRHPVLKAPPVRSAHSGIMNLPAGRPATTVNHSAPAAAGRLHSARADHRDGCGPAPQSHPASLPAASPPATSGNTPPAHRRYSRRENIFPLRRSHHEAARLRWRTSSGVRQNR